MIDKFVGKVVSNGTSTSLEYVDNLGINDPRFNAGNSVYFQLKVKNTSSTTENNITVVDTIPSYIDPVSGPGSYNADTRQITFTIDSLQPNEEKTFTVQTQVKPQAQLNSINDGDCEVNKAFVSVNNASDEDSAQFCVAKTTPTVTGVTQVPSTGAEDLPILVASFSALAAGIFLKKKARFK
jgi:uncharacterized repeat protein (TIGR01451 family)